MPWTTAKPRSMNAASRLFGKAERRKGGSFAAEFVDQNTSALLISAIIHPKADLGADPIPGSGQFNTTHWSVVMLAGQSEDAQAAAALEQLCRSYWFPLYAYIRRKGHSPHDAQDLTQDFFARLLDKNYIRLARQERGRFRAFLLKSLNHFLVNDWVRRTAQKRGGGETIVSLDEQDAERLYNLEEQSLSPENLYDKRWALALLDRAIDRLRCDYEAAGKGAIFQQLSAWLSEDGAGDAYRRVAQELGSTEGAVKVAVHRIRHRFRDAIRAEIAQTVSTPDEVEGELQALMAALQHSRHGL
jgi:RNA polymerase sigma factor (sigma-70 family)